MAYYNFNIYGEPIFENPHFSEASKEELRVILALKETDGKADAAELCEYCGISEARLHSALMFWESAGVISAKSKEDIGFYGNEITDEFRERYEYGGAYEISAADAAKIIRDNGLSTLFDELSAMAKKELTPREIRELASYVSNCKISEEYIMTLAAHLDGKVSFTVHNLLFKIKRLTEKGILTPEELNMYISESENKFGALSEYRKIFGIYDRNIGDGEKKYIEKWSSEYCFGTEIVKLAFSKSTLTIGKLSFTYMDAILTDWHQSGCKTLDECERRYEARKAELQKEYAEKRTAAPAFGRAKKKEEPRFGNFDPEEAFKLALERTYSNVSEEEG